LATKKNDYYKDFVKNKPVSLVNQKIAFLQSFPETQCSVKKGTLHWNGLISPTPISKEYPVEIIYRLKKSPRVFVKDDTIAEINTEKIPHKFFVDKENNKIAICLYTNGEFTSQEWIYKTIIPWATEWLFHYEIWRATGTWCGGGKHPHKGDQIRQDKYISDLENCDKYIKNDFSKNQCK